MLQQKIRKKVSLGRTGEDIACHYLTKKGYKIIKRNFYDRTGEIDIIAIDKNVLVFIEVKTRISKRYGDPIEAVTPKKVRSIKRTGLLYAQKNNLINMKMRIEVLSIEKKVNKFQIKTFYE